MAGVKPGWRPEGHAATPPFATNSNAFIHKRSWREKKQINKQSTEDRATVTTRQAPML